MRPTTLRTPLLALAGAALVLAAGCTGGIKPPITARPSPQAPQTAPAPAPPAGSATAAPTGRCPAAGLTLTAGRQGIAAGNIYQTLSFQNRSGSVCWLFGYPGLLMLDASGRALPTRVVRAGAAVFAGTTPTPQRVVLPPGAAATFAIHYGDNPSGAETACPESQTLLVIPPDETEQLHIGLRMAPCQGGTIDVSAVQPPGVPMQ